MNTKVVYAKDLTPQEQIIALQELKAAIEVERNKLEPMPEFVAPPPLIAWGDTELKNYLPMVLSSKHLLYFGFGNRSCGVSICNQLPFLKR